MRQDQRVSPLGLEETRPFKKNPKLRRQQQDELDKKQADKKRDLYRVPLNQFLALTNRQNHSMT